MITPKKYPTINEERDEDVQRLEKRVAELSDEVDNLRDMINRLTASMRGFVGYHVIEVEERPLSEAKELLLNYYLEHKGEAIYPDDAACVLGLDLKITMQAVNELIQEGKIEEAI